MKQPVDRREAIRAYKEQTQTQLGGLYRVVNTVSGWKGELQITANIPGQRSKMQFSKKVNSVFDPKLQEQWKQYGVEAFELEELELLEKKPDQSAKEFLEDLEALKELWMQK